MPPSRFLNVGLPDYDAGKNIKGNKRHILLDALGVLLTVNDDNRRDVGVASRFSCWADAFEPIFITPQIEMICTVLRAAGPSGLLAPGVRCSGCP
jgi:hypothetical protein